MGAGQGPERKVRHVDENRLRQSGFSFKEAADFYNIV